MQFTQNSSQLTEKFVIKTLISIPQMDFETAEKENLKCFNPI